MSKVVRISDEEYVSMARWVYLMLDINASVSPSKRTILSRLFELSADAGSSLIIRLFRSR